MCGWNLAVGYNPITDGDYRLRGAGVSSDGQSEELIVSGLRVRNTPQLNSNHLRKPANAHFSETGATPTVSATLPPTPTPLPENHAR